MKKKDYFYMLSLFMITISLVFVLKGQHLFGNSIDWFNQHVTISDSLRQAIRDEGTLFPTYLKNLMSGVNIYYFSYYGYLRLDILFGALFIHMKMIDIIIGYSFFLMILTVITCYIFLKRHIKNEEICLFMSILTLCSSLFFHSHKQIMFVNILPFLFLMLISIDHYLEKGKLSGLVLWGCCLIVHSYFYSVACFCVCFIYFIKQCDKHSYRRYLFDLFKVLILIFLCTAILTLPTLHVILSNHKNVSSLNLKSILLPWFDLKGLIYNNYGCGFTYLIWILIVLGLFKKKTHFLSSVLIIIMIFPIFSWILNGFLYARSKILIAFIPLVVLQAGLVLEDYTLKINPYFLLFLLFPLFFIERPFLVVIDLILSLWILSLKDSKKYLLYLLIPFVVVYCNNPRTSFLSKKQYQNYTSNQATKLIERNKMNRLALLNQTTQTMNQTFSNTVIRESGYTSTNHALYNSFIYDTLKLPISINNRVGQLDQLHPFYLNMMSIDSIITTQKLDQYTLIDQVGKYKLYQNKQALPVAYAINQLYNIKAFQKLKYPYTLDTLYQNAIINKGKANYQSQFKPIDLNIEQEYPIHLKKKVTNEYKLPYSFNNQYVVLSFDVINQSPKQSVSITINGIKNKLSRINTPYYNENNRFTYLFSQKELKSLHVSLSKGSYLLKNIKMYTLDTSSLNKKVDALKIKKGKALLNGTIDVSKSGYFITNYPYDKGYQIKIDGKEVKSEVVNTAFLGCPISKGKHHIQITFEPTGYRLGFVLTYLGMYITIILFIIERKKKR